MLSSTLVTKKTSPVSKYSGNRVFLHLHGFCYHIGGSWLIPAKKKRSRNTPKNGIGVPWYVSRLVWTYFCVVCNAMHLHRQIVQVDAPLSRASFCWGTTLSITACSRPARTYSHPEMSRCDYILTGRVHAVMDRIVPQQISSGRGSSHLYKQLQLDESGFKSTGRRSVLLISRVLVFFGILWSRFFFTYWK